MQGLFSEESLEVFNKLASATQGLDYSESGTDSYDFTRCVRPNGTAYGTGGKCKKGTEEAEGFKPGQFPREGKKDLNDRIVDMNYEIVRAKRKVSDAFTHSMRKKAKTELANIERRRLKLLKEYKGWDYSESGTDSYDFTRCVRPNGTAYGTGGKCKKGTEREKEAPKLSPGAKVLNSLLKWGMTHEKDSLTKEEQQAIEKASPRQIAETLNEVSKDKTFWKDLSVSVVKGFANGFMRGLE